ncbi:MAG: hydroxylamine reductase [Chitinivibrionales bacterium]|nr:hydroxylamine reductase [Chitinivibrionales bacterium]
MSMYCYQCEQTARGVACESSGVCGKQPDVAGLQDLLLEIVKGISFCAHEGRKLGAIDDGVDRFVVEALFSTVTNVNFDVSRLEKLVLKAGQLRDKARSLYETAARTAKKTVVAYPEAVTFTIATTAAAMLPQAQRFSLRPGELNPDIRSLHHLLIFGLKGMAAYVDHALILDKNDTAVYAYIHKALAALTTTTQNVEELVGLCLECGEKNIRAMELLNQGHIGSFGVPQPTPVSTGTRKGAAIIVSGHDLVDLEALLKQTEGTGIHIYTHGEMLPAHGYPGLKKYKHLAGHFGTAWQNQQKEFDNIQAAILFTTNCIQKPKESYQDRVFTTGLVAWPQVTHIENRDFSKIIRKAKELSGFEERSGTSIMTGFGHDAVLSVADAVISGVKSGAIKHFFLVGGCDGAKPGRNYYTEFVEQTPKDTVVLTLACGKFRFNHLDLGSIGAIPRLLDIGQCNDAYSAVKIAQALAGAFQCTVNDLPLSLVLSWYEQKAVVILLSLLHLGIRNIRLGPSLPAFLTPNILNFLVDKFNIMPITTPEHDLKAILKR